MPKTLTIIGSTGSIGTQALDIVRSRDDIEVIALSAGSKLELLVDQIKEFRPRYVTINSSKHRESLRELFPEIEVLDSVVEIAKLDVDVFLSAIVGIAGLEANLTAMQHAARVAVANKETLVAAGHLVNEYKNKYGSELIPVDSEHAAIAQALMAGATEEIDHIVITSSGGPFRNREDLSNVTVEEALKHPTWLMGPKITVDCSTLMNKGLEVIEAHQLFNISYDKIKVVIHPQSIVHGAVYYHDGNMIAQLAPPDMRIPIQFALDYPRRLPLGGSRGIATATEPAASEAWLSPRDDMRRHCERSQAIPIMPPSLRGAEGDEAIPMLDLAALAKLEFYEVDHAKFPALNLAYHAGRLGHSYPTVLNAANEKAVAQFLNGELRYDQIVPSVERALEQHKMIVNPSLEDILYLSNTIVSKATA